MFASLFILRLAVAIIFIYHGLPKITKAKKMSGGMGFSPTTVLIIGLVECLSSLGLVFGIFIKLSALLLALVMIGATYMKIIKWHIPFSARDKMGWEFDFILLAASIVIFLIV